MCTALKREHTFAKTVDLHEKTHDFADSYTFSADFGRETILKTLRNAHDDEARAQKTAF